jgi:predicted phage terminase large subunit-like protein
VGWYDDLSVDDQTLARCTPEGLAHVHTKPYPEDSGQRWKLFPYLRLIAKRIYPLLIHGGKAMIFMPPRHGKSLFSSVYLPAWFVMFFQTKNVIQTSYSGDLAQGFSKKAKSVVNDLGHLFGVRVSPDKHSADNWQVQIAQQDGSWHDGGEVFAAGADGPLPGRGGHLIVMDDVVRGHRDTTPTMMQKAYGWYQSVLSTREEPGCVQLLVMTRWAQADLAGRLLEDDPEGWQTISLPALAKEDDLLGRKEGEPLCPERYSREWLEKRRDSSDEGGLIFSSLYQQEPMPEGGAIFRSEHLHRWESVGKAVRFGNTTIPWTGLTMWFATIDPALKEKEINDPTGFLVFALAPRAELLCIEDHTARMPGSDGLIPLMRRVQEDHPKIIFYVEEKAHGTEIIRACQRVNLPVKELEADTDKVTRWIGAQPAFAAGKVFLPAHGANPLIRELLEVPGSKHDDRADCMAYGVRVWRDLVKQLHGVPPFAHERQQAKAPTADMHPSERPSQRDSGRDKAGHWRP